MNTIHLVTAIDVLYIQHAGVMLCSLFENNPSDRFFIYVLVNFDQNRELTKLQRIAEKYNQTLRVINIADRKVKNLKTSGHATQAVYFRLLIPELIDFSIEKVLYLDSDIIVKKNIAALWNTDLQHYPLAAVREAYFDRHQQLGMSPETLYFNSGVLLINLPVWRSERVSERTIEYIEQYPDRIETWDQDGLNAVLQGNWLALHPVWNLQSLFTCKPANELDVNAQQLQESLTDPAVIHYSSKFKPWHVWCDHPLKDEYYRYLKLTPWKHFRLPEQTKWHWLKQRAKRYVNSVVRKKAFTLYG